MSEFLENLTRYEGPEGPQTPEEIIQIQKEFETKEAQIAKEAKFAVPACTLVILGVTYVILLINGLL